MNEQKLWIKLKLRALLLLSRGPLCCPSSSVTASVSATRVASESAMDGLSESSRFNSGVLGISIVALASKPEAPSSTGFVDGGRVGDGGAHSNSRYGFRHFGIPVQCIPE